MAARAPRVADFLRRRHEWFLPPPATSLVLFRVSVGERPTVETALDRLERLRRDGSTPEAFGPRDLARFAPSP